jgi:hypothetical protein
MGSLSSLIIIKSLECVQILSTQEKFSFLENLFSGLFFHVSSVSWQPFRLQALREIPAFSSLRI